MYYSALRECACLRMRTIQLRRAELLVQRGGFVRPPPNPPCVRACKDTAKPPAMAPSTSTVVKGGVNMRGQQHYFYQKRKSARGRPSFAHANLCYKSIIIPPVVLYYSTLGRYAPSRIVTVNQLQHSWGCYNIIHTYIHTCGMKPSKIKVF